MERERRDRELLLHNERIQCWQDLQALYLQARQVTKEREEEVQDYTMSRWDAQHREGRPGASLVEGEINPAFPKYWLPR